MGLIARSVPVALALLGGCRIEVGAPAPLQVAEGGAPAGEVWVYTSVYPQVIEALEALIVAELPEVDAQFYQAEHDKELQLHKRLVRDLHGAAVYGDPACGPGQCRHSDGTYFH